MGTFKISGLMMKSLFKKPATENYPNEPKEWDERTRGHIEITREECILCGICMKKCPAQALTVIKEERKWEINRMRCVQCGHCVEVCPKKCLHMKDDYFSPEYEVHIDIREIPEKKKEPAAEE